MGPFGDLEVSLGYVRLSEADFAEFSDGPNLFATEADEDAFTDMPNPAELLRNYPLEAKRCPTSRSWSLWTARGLNPTRRASGHLTDAPVDKLNVVRWTLLAVGGHLRNAHTYLPRVKGPGINERSHRDSLRIPPR